MKNYYLLLFFFLGLSGKAQIVNIPDANFKAKLLLANSNNTIAANLSGNYFKIDANNNGEIEVSEALNVSNLNINVQSLQSLDGILYFSNLERLNCSSNQLSSLNVSGLTKLIFLNCNDNQLTSLNVDGLMNLTTLECGYNQLNSLDISNLNKLNTLYCSNNNITSLILNNLNLFYILIADYNQLTYFDVSNINSNMALYIYLSHNNLQSYNTSNIYHETLDLTFNPNLSSLFIKDGDIYTYLHDYFMGNTNLTYICADEGEVDSINQYFQTQIIPSHPSFNCQVNSYCSFTPGGQFYTIQGQNKFDNENDGCDVADGFFPNLKYSITDGTNTGSLISNNTGNYSIPIQTGTYSITPILENPSYFNITPTNVVVNFPTQTSPYTQNFCITPNGEIHDVEVSIIPTGVARPGFDCNYQIIFKNKGNQTENGTINLAFDDTIFDFVSTNVATSSQTFGNLNWIYSNLQPLETRSINVTLNLNSPMETPAVNADDIINLIATITSPDEIPCNNWLQSQCDNIFTLNQTVVNSYDPNDKTCLQGNKISPDRVGGFVHYMIRFENTGTFPAENIVVKDMIDTSKFDISSLIPLNASHNYITKIAGNKVEFIFENINLPFDDAYNDGYIAFKIKTLPSLVLGDTFSNLANIYFDYNFPIITNTATTTIAALSNPSFEFSNYFSLYPNPTTNELNINLKSAIEIQSIQIYNTIGQLVTVQTGNALKVDVSNLKTGNYFIKINTNEGYSSSQFIKE